MAIAFVNGATNNGSGVQTVSVTYSPTAGNIVCVFISFNTAVTNISCVDSSNNPLTAGPGVSNGFQGACFYYTAASGITSFTVSWTTSAGVNIACAEYSGVVGPVNASLPGNTATGNSTTASITVTTQDNNDWIVGGMLATTTITVTVGNQRENAATAAVKLKIVDNTVATAGSLSLTGTLASGAWAIAVLELRSVTVLTAGSTSNWISKQKSSGVNKH